MKITSIVLTKNEEKNIEACLKTLMWTDEVLVIDDDSSDETVSLAKKLHAKVFKRQLLGNFAMQRNFGLEKAAHEWVLFIDADERVSETLALEIQSIIQNATAEECGFFLRREDTQWGKTLQHGEQGDVKLLRLAKRDAGKWTGMVHEIWCVEGSIGVLRNKLSHFPHQTLTEFLSDINFYTSLRAKELFEKGKKANILTILLYTKGKFLQDYILKLGFLDGMQGFLVAVLMSLHSFLVRGKLWELTEKN